MKAPLIVLILAAVAIFAAVEYRLSQPDERQPRSMFEEAPRSIAPSFAGYDSDMHLFRLKSFIGRQALLVVFCGEDKDVLHDSNVAHLIAHQTDVAARGFRVVIVTMNLPQEIRAIELPDGFDLISDFEQSQTGELFKAHKSFASFDPAKNAPLAKIFFIDRAGNVAFSKGAPQGLGDPITDLDHLLGVEPHAK